MENELMFLDCPAYLDAQGAARCGLPAEVEDWYTVRSSDGPLESAKIRCPRGHWFNGPLESLTVVSPQARASSAHRGGAAARSEAAR
jgi:hypothetical protein